MEKEILSCSIANQKYTIVACSIMGNGKIENQDSYNIYKDDNQIIITVADGLGSAIFSKEGSNKMADICSDLLITEQIDDEFSSKLFKRWKNSLSGKLELYDTTIKFIKITKEDIFLGGIGDGWIAMLSDDTIVSKESNNLFSNQTDSILSFDLRKKFFIEKFSNINNLAITIATDGFSEDIDKSNIKSFLIDIERDIKNNVGVFMDELANTLKNWPVTSNKDDKTVILIVKEC